MPDTNEPAPVDPMPPAVEPTHQDAPPLETPEAPPLTTR